MSGGLVVFATNSGYAAPVKEPVGLLIAAARRRMKRAVQDRVAPHGLTPQQFWVLVNIDEAEGPSLGEIAARLRLWLTALGRGKIGPLRALAAELRSASVHGLTRDEEETLRALLRKIIRNLDALTAR